jgi:phage-related minor tail protein
VGVSAGTAFVDIQPKIGQGFFAKLSGGLGGGGALRGVGLAAGATIGAGVVAGIGGAAVLTSIGNTFDQAFDTIRVGTGATGDSLEGLKEDFKAVFADVPTDTGLAAQAIADLNTRTGLFGDSLQGLATVTLEGSRLLGEDLGGVIETGTRLFGDWGVAVETDGVATLDKMFRASQATGVPMTRLQDLLVKYGAPLRQFGFGMEEGAALLASFEKEGVNTELVMGSLRQALGRFARDGREPVEALRETFEQIENTGSAAEANALAMEVFGARAGPDMAAAIREGRFEIDDLLSTIQNGDETILGAAEATESFGEKWTKLKNKVFVALEPLATKFIDTLGSLFDVLGPKIEPFIETISTALAPIGAIFDAIVGGAEETEGTVGPLFESIQGYIEGVKMAFQTAFQIIGDVWNALVGIFQQNKDKIAGILESLGTIVRSVFEAIQRFWNTWGETILTTITNVVSTVIDVISAAFDVIVGIFDVVLGILTGDWSRAWDGIKQIVGGVWDAIKAIVSGALNTVLTLVGDILGKVLGGVATWIGDMLSAIGGWGIDFVAAIVDTIAGIPGMFVQLGLDIVSGILSGLGGLFGALKDKLVGSIGDALGAVGRFFGIGSPSKVFRDELGVPLAQGITVGIGGSAEGIASTLVDAIASASAAAERALTQGVSVGGIAGSLDLAGRDLRGLIGSDDRPSMEMILQEGAVQVFGVDGEDAGIAVPRELRRLALDFARS